MCEVRDYADQLRGWSTRTKNSARYLEEYVQSGTELTAFQKSYLAAMNTLLPSSSRSDEIAIYADVEFSDAHIRTR